MSRGPLTREGLCARAFTHKEKPRLPVVSQTGPGAPGAGRRLLEKGLAWIGQTRPALTRATAAALTCVGPTAPRPWRGACVTEPSPSMAVKRVPADLCPTELATCCIQRPP